MALFVCSGQCESCEEAARCPVKHDMQSAENEYFADRFGSGPLADIMRGLIAEISHEKIVRVLGSSLFKLIQLIMIEGEESDNFQPTKEILQARIEEIFPEKIRKAFDLFRQGDAKMQNDPLTKKILRTLLPEIAEKIHRALQGECTQNCYKCYLKGQCPIEYQLDN